MLKILPPILRDDLILKLKGFNSWHDIKEAVLENARLLMVYGKPTPVHLAPVDEQALAQMDDMPLDQVLDELGADADQSTVWAIVERRQQRRLQQGRFPKRFPERKPPEKPSQEKGGQYKAPMSKEGKPLCANCGEVGHDKFSCPKERLEPGKRPCFKCGKVGHSASQCKSGLPARSLEAEQPGDEPDNGDKLTLVMECEGGCCPDAAGAKFFPPSFLVGDSDSEDSSPDEDDDPESEGGR